eukprot:gene4065-4737_t
MFFSPNRPVIIAGQQPNGAMPYPPQMGPNGMPMPYPPHNMMPGNGVMMPPPRFMPNGMPMPFPPPNFMQHPAMINGGINLHGSNNAIPVSNNTAPLITSFPEAKPSPSSSSSSKPVHPSLSDIFDDLSSRFVINIPAEELESFERLLFQIEAAYWFYDDFYREDNHSLPKYSLGEFTKNQVEEILKKFSMYKTRVPVYGAIILNPTLDKALFVKGFHSSSWGFPKGKVNKDELDSDCAVREVLEETGFDISPYLDPRHFIEIFMKEQKIKLYIVAGIPEDTFFLPRTRKEISKIEWLLIEDLPTFTTKKVPGQQSMTKERNFFRSIPFFINGTNNNNTSVQQEKVMVTPKVIAARGSLQPPASYSPYPESPPASPRKVESIPMAVNGTETTSSFYTQLSTPNIPRQQQQQQHQHQNHQLTPNSTYKQPTTSLIQQQQQPVNSMANHTSIPLNVAPIPPLPTIAPPSFFDQVKEAQQPPAAVASTEYPSISVSSQQPIFRFENFNMADLLKSFSGAQ